MTSVKAEVLKAAYKLFVEKGYTATSMRDISALAKVSQGGIYNHFSTKEDIFVELLNDKIPLLEFMKIFRKQTLNNDNFEDVFKKTAYEMLKTLDRNIQAVMIIEHHEFNSKHVKPILAKIMKEFKELSLFVDRLKEEKKLKKYQTQLMFQAFFSLLIGEAMVSTKINRKKVSKTRVNTLVEMFFMGVLNEKRR